VLRKQNNTGHEVDKAGQNCTFAERYAGCAIPQTGAKSLYAPGWAYAVLLAFRHFAQRAFCAARIRAVAAADILRRFLEAIETTF